MNFNPYMENGMGLPQNKFQGPQPGLGRGRGGPRFANNPGFRGRGGNHEGRRFRGRGRGSQGPGFRREKPPTRQDLELNKPWIDAFLAREIRLTFDLKDSAGQTKRHEDFRNYADQRDKARELVRNSREAYFNNNPGQENHWLPILAMESSQLPFTCDNCEMEFSSENDLLSHELKHEVCGLDGCTYTVVKNKLEIHILHMHASGLYNRVHKGYTPEDIEKWRADRRKNFPCAAKNKEAQERKQIKNDRKRKYLDGLKEKQEEIEAKKRKKQEELKSKSRSRKRGKKRRAENDPNPNEVKEVKTIESDEEQFPFWFGNIRKFKGTKFHLQSETLKNQDEGSEDAVANFDISDEEWAEAPKICADLSSKETPGITSHEILVQSSDDEPPEEQSAAVRKEQEPVPVLPVIQPETQKNTNKPVINAFKKESEISKVKKTTCTPEAVERRLMQRRKRAQTLLEKLLRDDIDKETDELLQCVRYVCLKNFFDLEKSLH